MDWKVQPLLPCHQYSSLMLKYHIIKSYFWYDPLMNSVLVLVNHKQKYITNCGDFVKKVVFCGCKLALSSDIMVFFSFRVSLVFISLFLSSFLQINALSLFYSFFLIFSDPDPIPLFLFFTFFSICHLVFSLPSLFHFLFLFLLLSFLLSPLHQSSERPTLSVFISILWKISTFFISQTHHHFSLSFSIYFSLYFLSFCQFLPHYFSYCIYCV